MPARQKDEIIIGESAYLWLNLTIMPSGCWEWSKTRNPDGYGIMTWQGSRDVVSRIVWAIIHGAIPEGTKILHRCDNPPCARPSHLFAGTQRDNMLDAKAKGRTRKGQRQPAEAIKRGAEHGAAKLTESDVRSIRERYAGGETQRALAAAYGVSFGNIHLIVNRKNWQHL